MKKIPVYAFLALLTALNSCKKDEEVGPTPVTEKYMTLTTGSTWNYKLTSNPSTTPMVSNYTITATANDSTANGKLYKVFSNSMGANEYFNITGNDYYTFRQLPATLNVAPIEVLYLKSGAAVNDTWYSEAPMTLDAGLPIPINITVRFTQKVAQKGLTRTVNGITYNNVTDVQTTLTVSGIPVTYNLTSNIHFYYAPNVGQIESYTKIDFSATGFDPISFEEKRELQSATIL